MTTVREQLKLGFELLSKAGVAEPRREASILLEFALRRDKTFLIAHPEYELTSKEELLTLSVLKRRADREPFHYIIGKKEFYGLEFVVTRDVLIPRPETEILVAEAIKLLSENKRTRFCEIGVGSGCISVSIVANVPTVSGVAGDVSPKALAVARENAENNQAIDRLTFVESDVFAHVPAEKFDLIVSNPPYIPSEDIAGLQPEVRDHEPTSALTDGEDGLAIVRRIVDGASERLNIGGTLLVEIGWDQSERVSQMVDSAEWLSIEFLPDLQAIPRILKALRR